jgi:hypothetical protein
MSESYRLRKTLSETPSNAHVKPFCNHGIFGLIYKEKLTRLVRPYVMYIVTHRCSRDFRVLY